jgi:hypothetical protein
MPKSLLSTKAALVLSTVVFYTGVNSYSGFLYSTFFFTINYLQSKQLITIKNIKPFKANTKKPLIPEINTLASTMPSY